MNPERLQRWFGVVTGNLTEGGQYQIEGNAHGTIETCTKPSHLSLTWEANGGIGWLLVSLEAIEQNNTQLRLEHIARDDEELRTFWAQFGPGALGVGWDISLDGLVQYLATGEAPDSADENWWTGTEAGKTSIRASSKGWVEAAIAFGEPKEAAETAGQTTYNFYTGSEG